MAVIEEWVNVIGMRIVNINVRIHRRASAPAEIYFELCVNAEKRKKQMMYDYTSFIYWAKSSTLSVNISINIVEQRVYGNIYAAC